jgi:hypothetical protein
VVELEMIPLRQQVSIFSVYMAFDGDGALKAPEVPDRQARAVLDELVAAARRQTAGA